MLGGSLFGQHSKGQIGHRVGQGLGLPEQISLHEQATLGLERFRLFAMLYAFRNDTYAQIAADSEHRANHREIGLLCQHARDKGTVDFHDIYGEVLEVGE